jgi:hypothetical protein
MTRLAPFVELILDAVREYRRKNAVAGWYTAGNLIEWLKKKFPAEWKALMESYGDAPKPAESVRDAIDAYLPSLNQRVLHRYPTNIIWRVSATTQPPEVAPVPDGKSKPSRPSRQRGQPWVALIDKKDLEGLRRWLDDGGDPNAQARVKGEEPLDYAAVFGDVGMVRLLLERGAKGKQPLFEAVSNDRGEVARLLLQSGVSTLDDLRQAGSLLRAVVDDPELERLIRKELRQRRK